jgi:predicted RNase H-like HicB family nuclease
MPLKGEIIVEFDREKHEYLAMWEPVVFGMGKTEKDAVEDMMAAAELFIESTHRETVGK